MKKLFTQRRIFFGGHENSPKSFFGRKVYILWGATPTKSLQLEKSGGWKKVVAAPCPPLGVRLAGSWTQMVPETWRIQLRGVFQPKIW